MFTTWESFNLHWNGTSSWNDHKIKTKIKTKTHKIKTHTLTQMHKNIIATKLSDLQYTFSLRILGFRNLYLGLGILYMSFLGLGKVQIRFTLLYAAAIHYTMLSATCYHCVNGRGLFQE